MGTEKREQQKIYLTPSARQRLRDEAETRGVELSEVVEHLVVEGGYPTEEEGQSNEHP